ncbi:MAG: hypothetical protein G01um10148_95 [Parcubacteria group bacterium Gr01-1014_8]|nr:MAG: hypothetical protein G01um10148_95 [Parcubacteria group bacterium Gr01-1014_8]
MHWMVAHIYVTALVVVGLLLIAGTALVTSRTPVGSSQSETTWGGAGGIAFLNAIGGRAGSSQGRIKTQQLLEQQAQDHTPVSIIPTDGSEISQGYADIEWQSLLTQLVRPKSTTDEVATEPDGTPSLYSFIPSGLMSTTGSAKQRTPAQDELFEYGNSVGSYIQGFDDLHGNMIQVLKDAYEDRKDPEKIARAMQIGADYVQLGKELEEMEVGPKVVRSAHLALAKAYQVAGSNMIAKMKTSSDEDFIAAVNTYNQSVEDFTKRYIALVTIFEVAEVQFSQDDPGKVFMFQSAPSL